MSTVSQKPSTEMQKKANIAASPSQSRHLLWWMSLAVVLLTASAFRFIALEADPPSTVHGHFITDEGWWAFNARNHALFGQWVLDEYNPGYYAAPVYSFLLRLNYALAGVGLVQTRMVTAAAGLVSIICVGLILGKTTDRWSAVAGMAILGFDYFVVTFNRVAFVESVPSAWMAIALALYILGRNNRICLGLAGVTAVLACFAKINSAFFVPALPLAGLIYTWMQTSRLKSALKIWRREVLAYSLGAGLCLTAWLIFFILPQWNQFIKQASLHAAENKTPLGLYMLSLPWSWGLTDDTNGIRFTGFLAYCLLPIVLACLWLIYFGLRVQHGGLRKQLERLTLTELSAVSWIVCMGFPLLVTKHAADRRYYNLAIPLAILAAFVLIYRRHEILTPAANYLRNFASWKYWAAVFAFLFPLVLYLRVPVANLVLPWTDHLALGSRAGLSPTTCCALAAILIVIVGILTFPQLMKYLHKSPLHVGTVSTGLCLLAMTVESIHYYQAITNPSYTIRQASQQMEQILPADAVVVGGTSDSLLFDTKLRTFTLLDRRWLGLGVLNSENIQDNQPTHCLLDGRLSGEKLNDVVNYYLRGQAEPAPLTSRHFSLCHYGENGPRFRVTLCQVQLKDIDDQDMQPSKHTIQQTNSRLVHK